MPLSTPNRLYSRITLRHTPCNHRFPFRQLFPQNGLQRAEFEADLLEMEAKRLEEKALSMEVMQLISNLEAEADHLEAEASGLEAQAEALEAEADAHDLEEQAKKLEEAAQTLEEAALEVANEYLTDESDEEEETTTSTRLLVMALGKRQKTPKSRGERTTVTFVIPPCPATSDTERRTPLSKMSKSDILNSRIKSAGPRIESTEFDSEQSIQIKGKKTREQHSEQQNSEQNAKKHRKARLKVKNIRVTCRWKESRLARILRKWKKRETGWRRRRQKVRRTVRLITFLAAAGAAQMTKDRKFKDKPLSRMNI